MKKILYLLIITFSFTQLQAQKTYIWCGTLIDGISNDPKINMTIIIDSNKILSVESGFTRGSTNDKTIDLKTKTVTPGWMDMHVHLSSETNPNRHLEQFQLNDADYAYRSVGFAKKRCLAVSQQYVMPGVV